MITRRSFLSALACLPFVGVLVLGAQEPSQTFTTSNNLKWSNFSPPAHGRSLSFPCQPQSVVVWEPCDPLAANKLIVIGKRDDWQGFKVCRNTDDGEKCVSLPWPE